MRWPALARLRAGTTHHRLTLGLGIATLIIGAWLLLQDDPRAPAGPSDAAESALAERSTLEPALGPASAEVRPDLAGLPHACEDLAARAREGGPDAVLLAWLCPEWPLDAVAARAALLAVRSPEEAAALVPRLADHPALQGLLRLVAQLPAPVATELPDPSAAVVSPIDDQVLARVQRAHATIAARGIGPSERTRARAWVAKTYLQATQQLGVGVGRPLEPFARLLAGRALHHGRQLCTAYLQRRVSGLAPLFQEVEARLWVIATALEASPHHGDAARLAVELEETRRYLQRQGPRDRLARYQAAHTSTPREITQLDPLVHDRMRLLDHGFVDLAIARAIDEATRPEGPGLLPMEQLLRDTLARAEREEYLALLERRLARARARKPPPAEHGARPPEPLVEPPWPDAGVVAEEAAGWIERAPPEPELPRRYALGRALLLIRARPDALVLLIDHATAADASPSLRRAVGWLSLELAARDDGRLAWLARRVAAEPRGIPGNDLDRSETARRRRFALSLRQDGRMPRGPGMIDG